MRIIAVTTQMLANRPAVFTFGLTKEGTSLCLVSSNATNITPVVTPLSSVETSGVTLITVEACFLRTRGRVMVVLTKAAPLEGTSLLQMANLVTVLTHIGHNSRASRLLMVLPTQATPNSKASFSLVTVLTTVRALPSRTRMAASAVFTQESSTGTRHGRKEIIV